MYMYICVHMCIYVYTYVCVCICICICITYVCSYLGLSAGSHLGAILGDLGVILGHFGAMLVPSWAILGPCWSQLEGIMGHVRAILEHLDDRKSVLRSEEASESLLLNVPRPFGAPWKRQNGALAATGCKFCSCCHVLCLSVVQCITTFDSGNLGPKLFLGGG